MITISLINICCLLSSSDFEEGLRYPECTPDIGCSDLGKWIPVWPVAELYQRGVCPGPGLGGEVQSLANYLSLHLYGDGGHGDAGLIYVLF